MLKAALRSRGLYIFRALPRGFDVLYDLRHELSHLTINIVFDVGANVGQSTDSFSIEFPNAQIWSFEPAAELHAQLFSRFSGNGRVRCERLAIGASEGETSLVHTRDPTMYHIASKSSELLQLEVVKGSEKVIVTTLDSYCQRNGIERIDFLKIDTEGYDLEVLRGATAMFSRGLISCVQCECSVNPDNQFHCPLESVQRFLEARGYRLFGLYEQTKEWIGRTPNLRRVNAVYISPDVMQLSRIEIS